MNPAEYFVCIFLFAFLHFTSSDYILGFESNDRCDSHCMQCMKEHGYRMYAPIFGCSQSAWDTIVANAKDAHRANLALYGRFTDPCERSSELRAKEIVNGTDIYDLFHSFFFEVTDPRVWNESQEVNQKNIEDLMRHISIILKQRGLTTDLGIFTNQEDEKVILGPAWHPAGLNLSLWYSHHDGNEDMLDYQPFGPWRTPTLKQFTNLVSGPCGLGLFRTSYNNNVPRKQGSDFIVVIWVSVVSLALVVVLLVPALVYFRRTRHRYLTASNSVCDLVPEIQGQAHDISVRPESPPVAVAITDARIPAGLRSFVEEIAAMAAAHVGGTLIIPAGNDPFLSEICKEHQFVGEPLKRGSLPRLFTTRRDGHDGAAVIDVAGSEPLIRASQVHLPYDRSKLSRTVQGRGTRHNSALYASTLSNSLFVVVSEEHGTIRLFHNGCDSLDITEADLLLKLQFFLFLEQLCSCSCA